MQISSKFDRQGMIDYSYNKWLERFLDDSVNYEFTSCVYAMLILVGCSFTLLL